MIGNIVDEYITLLFENFFGMQDLKSYFDKMKSRSFEEMCSRDNLIDCPHMMVLLRYLQKRHGIPKYGFLNKELRYHYTDAAGLLGIIQNGRLWATHLRFLNDPSEGSFFPERVLAFMRAKPGGINEAEKIIIDGIGNALINPKSSYDNFSVSLSANGDLLSQWRGYGSFGNGYAIGFRLHEDMPNLQFISYCDVVYGDEGLEELAIDLLELFVLADEKWKGRMYEEWAITLSVLAKSFKDPSYSEEQESRLLCSYQTSGTNNFKRELPLKYRSRGSDVIPYIPMSLHFLNDDDEPRLPIERIVVGPGVDFERNYESINSLLKECSYDNVKIVKSTIPFRP